MVGSQLVVVFALVVIAALVYDNDGYVAHRRVKNQKPWTRSHGTEDGKNDDGDINVCALEQKTAINLFCYCDDSAERAATSADCWVVNDGEPRDAPVWREFRSQSNVTKLTFNVRGSTSRTLTFVPTESIAQLPELRTLEIVYADINTVHTHAFANLSRLQDLALGRNNIVRLARESVAYMADLRVATLGDNAIDGISNDVFAGLPALRKLYMDSNNISYIAEGAFEQLRKLEELDVSNNRLTGSLSRYVFLGLVSLKRLDMRANRLSRVGPDAFAELVSLEELVLEDNALKTVDGRGFAGLPSLQRLTLAENRLTALDDHTFDRLEKLRFVDVRFNSLRSLTYRTVEPLVDRLRNTSFHLYIQGNAFVCDCSLLWMNRVAMETINEQVNAALSDVQCQMNDTSDGLSNTGEGSAWTTLDKKAYAGTVRPRGVPAYDGRAAGSKDTVDDVGASSSSSSSSDAVFRVSDSSRLIDVSAMNEDTCPGKEQPAVDGAPDAAQNSDRVLWESAESSAAVGPVASSRPILSAAAAATVFALGRFLHRHNIDTIKA